MEAEHGSTANDKAGACVVHTHVHWLPDMGRFFAEFQRRFYVLVAIVRKRLALERSLYQILQILSITILEKVPILQAFEAFDSQSDLLDNSNQLILFDF